LLAADQNSDLQSGQKSFNLDSFAPGVTVASDRNSRR